MAVAGVVSPNGSAPLPVEGRIDRIAVTADAVWIADFKSGSSAGSPRLPAYVAQLALYRAALMPLYPGVPIRAFLVWLGDAETTELAPALLDAALAGLPGDSGVAPPEWG